MSDTGDYDARMELSADEIREQDEGYFIECPSCGTSTKLLSVVESGHCANDCGATLGLELVWSE